MEHFAFVAPATLAVPPKPAPLVARRSLRTMASYAPGADTPEEPAKASEPVEKDARVRGVIKDALRSNFLFSSLGVPGMAWLGVSGAWCLAKRVQIWPSS